MRNHNATQRGSAFVRPRTVRIASVASVGAMVGFSLLAGAASASATTSADCNAGNTVNAKTPGAVAQIQTLLTANTATICLIGTFSVPTALSAPSDVTLFGEPHATLTGTGVDRLISADESLTVENLTLTHGAGAGQGGAISAGGDVTAINSTFEHDTSSGGYGGAIYGYAVLDVESSTFIDNHAAYGGAVTNSFGSVTIHDSTFSDNSSTASGGAVIAFSPLVVDASTFDHNTSVNGGAAVQAVYDTATITNSTFTRNASSATGQWGGAVLARGGSITESTFLDNTMPDAGSGQAVAASIDPITLLGNIFASSSPSKAEVGVTNGGTLVDAGGNVFSTTRAVETALTPDATSKFGASVASLFTSTTLGNHGGKTKTLAIGAESAAIGAVKSGTLPDDQRGKPRTLPADAGSFEYVATTTAATGPALPITGTDPTPLEALAAALLGVGALAVGAARLQRRRSTSRS